MEGGCEKEALCVDCLDLPKASLSIWKAMAGTRTVFPCSKYNAMPLLFKKPSVSLMCGFEKSVFVSPLTLSHFSSCHYHFVEISRSQSKL